MSLESFVTLSDPAELATAPIGEGGACLTIDVVAVVLVTSVVLDFILSD